MPLMVSMPLSAAISGDGVLYGGGIFDSAAEISAVDVRPTAIKDGTVLGDITYAAGMNAAQYIPTACTALQNRLAENYQTKDVLLLVSIREDVSEAQNAGINNYIWFPQVDT